MVRLLKICLVVAMLLALSGCVWVGPSPTPRPSPSPDTACGRIYVQSNCKACSGEIYVNDVNTGKVLHPFGATLLMVHGIQCGDIVRVYLINAAGEKSHTEVATATSPQTIFTFNWFLHYPGYR